MTSCCLGQKPRLLALAGVEAKEELPCVASASPDDWLCEKLSAIDRHACEGCAKSLVIPIYDPAMHGIIQKNYLGSGGHAAIGGTLSPGIVEPTTRRAP